MKKFLLVYLLLAFAGISLSAQDIKVPAGYELADSIVYRPSAALDASLDGKSVFSVLNSDGGKVQVRQDASISSSMAKHVEANKEKKLSGYRVRVFFDNKQNSRSESETAMKRFQTAFPGIPAYRSYSSPFFKVTVGDFRTKSDALQLLSQVKPMFPSAFVVKENIEYPSVDRDQSFILDTIQVLRPKK